MPKRKFRFCTVNWRFDELVRGGLEIKVKKTQKWSDFSNRLSRLKLCFWFGYSARHMQTPTSQETTTATLRLVGMNKFFMTYANTHKSGNNNCHLAPSRYEWVFHCSMGSCFWICWSTFMVSGLETFRDGCKHSSSFLYKKHINCVCFL